MLVILFLVCRFFIPVGSLICSAIDTGYTNKIECDKGAFGSGAAFAMEDAYILAQAVEYSVQNKSTTTAAAAVKQALDILDEIRSPYYERMYVCPIYSFYPIV